VAGRGGQRRGGGSAMPVASLCRYSGYESDKLFLSAISNDVNENLQLVAISKANEKMTINIGGRNQ